MNLDVAEKAKLIEMLGESLLTSEQKIVERNWAVESQRRYDEYKSVNNATVDYSQIRRSRP